MGNILCGASKKPRYETPGIPQREARAGPFNANVSVAEPDQDPAPKSCFVIGIDFGTTYSGIAYCPFLGTTEATSGSLAEMRNIANSISVIKNWPNQTSFFTEKTPTLLAYNKPDLTWGWSVNRTDTPQVAFFKLGLEDNIADSHQARYGTLESDLGGYLAQVNWTHPQLPDKKGIDYATDYLSCLIRHLTSKVLVSRFGSEFLYNLKLSYVLTVPAIWSDKAKERTRIAAINAGIQGDALSLISEPEAAALYCATLCNEVDLRSGDHFLMCDAGGGTVDLIAYKVSSLTPFRVAECTVGTGGHCGAIYLDRRFENFILKKFEMAGITSIGDKRLASITEFFREKIKPRFNPYDSEIQSEYEIDVGLPDMPIIALKDGYLVLRRDDLQGIFEPVFKEILTLIKGQIDNVRVKYNAPIKTLFLVGGLGSSSYLCDYLRLKLANLDVKQPDMSHTAIMKGAVLYKLGLDLVETRVLRYSYGMDGFVPFKDGYHPEDRKVYDYEGVAKCEGYLHWFAKKGQLIANGTILQKTAYTDCDSGSSDYISSFTLWICEDDSPPEYLDKTGDTRYKSALKYSYQPPEAWKIRVGVGGEYRRLDYALGITIGAGGIEWRLLLEGKVIGSVECDYI